MATHEVRWARFRVLKLLCYSLNPLLLNTFPNLSSSSPYYIINCYVDGDGGEADSWQIVVWFSRIVFLIIYFAFHVKLFIFNRFFFPDFPQFLMKMQQCCHHSHFHSVCIKLGIDLTAFLIATLLLFYGISGIPSLYDQKNSVAKHISCQFNEQSYSILG